MRFKDPLQELFLQVIQIKLVLYKVHQHKINSITEDMH